VVANGPWVARAGDSVTVTVTVAVAVTVVERPKGPSDLGQRLGSELRGRERKPRGRWRFAATGALEHAHAGNKTIENGNQVVKAAVMQIGRPRER